MISNMDTEKKNGQMGPNTKEIIQMERKKAKESLHGLTGLPMKVISKTAQMVMEFIYGLTSDDLRANGKTTKCMGGACFTGLMDENLKEIM